MIIMTNGLYLSFNNNNDKDNDNDDDNNFCA